MGKKRGFFALRAVYINIQYPDYEDYDNATGNY